MCWHKHSSSGTVPGLLGEDGAGQRCSGPPAPSTCPPWALLPVLGGFAHCRGCGTQARALEQVQPRRAAEPGAADRTRGSFPAALLEANWAAEKLPPSCAVTATGPAGGGSAAPRGHPELGTAQDPVTDGFVPARPQAKRTPPTPKAARASEQARPGAPAPRLTGCCWDAAGMAVPSPAPRKQPGPE